MLTNSPMILEELQLNTNAKKTKITIVNKYNKEMKRVIITR